MEPDRDEIQRMQAGLRSWVLRAGQDSLSGVRRASPHALLSVLCAAALGPVVAVPAGITGVAGAGIGVLSSIGGGVLGDIIGKALDNLRSQRQERFPTPKELEDELTARLLHALTSEDQSARGLRVEISEVLKRIDAGAIMLRAAVDTGSERLRSDVIAGMGDLGARFSELRFLLGNAEQRAAEMQESLRGQDAKLRVIIEGVDRQSTEVRLAREQLATIEQRTRLGIPEQRSEESQGPRWLQGPPYRGLLPFDEAHAHVFYGRERLTAELVGILVRANLVIVTGASGAGKSSLLRAGLIPALARGLQASGSERWPCIVITPTRDPVTELATHLAALSGGSASTVREDLIKDPGNARMVVRQALMAYTARCYGERALPADKSERLVLIIDQFEEVFTLDTDGDRDVERRAFISALCDVTTKSSGDCQDPPAFVVIAVRGDFWDRCAAYPELAQALQKGQFVVGPMTESELRRTITSPAEAAGLQIDADLTETILMDLRATGNQETAPAGTLPLLSQAMLLTWENREGNRLTSHGYGVAGGVGRAVQSSAEAAYEALSPSEQTIARQILQRMTIVGRDGQLARRRVARDNLYAGSDGSERSKVDTVLEAFAGRRLVVLSDGNAEISHDALLHEWPRLRGWLEEDRYSWVLHSHLDEDASEWWNNGSDSSFLYRGTQLAALQQASITWSADPARYPDLTATQQEFLAASTKASTRNARRRRAVAGALVLFLLASLTGGVIAAEAARNSDLQRSIAVSGQLAAQSETLDGTDPITAAGLALAAHQIAATPQGYESMLEALAQPERAVFSTDSQPLNSVAFSRNGKVLATAGNDGSARLWNVTTHRQIGASITVGEPQLQIAFSPDGKILATVSSDGRLRLWNVYTQKEIGEPVGSGSAILDAVTFSPDGNTVATASYDGTVRLWNVSTHQQIGESINVGGAATGVAFSPNGRLLATGNSSGRAQVWNVYTHQRIGYAIAAGRGPTEVAFGPSGRILATGNENGALLWNVSSHRRIGLPMTGAGYVTSLAFSPDGMTLATASTGGAARLWGVGPNEQTGTPFAVDNAIVTFVAFSPDDKTLATASNDGSARLWDVTAYHQIGMPFITPTLPVYTLAVSPDGETLASTSFGGAVHLWNLAGRRRGESRRIVVGSSVTGLAFSPSSELLATSGDGAVRVWDVATGERIGSSMIVGKGSVDTVAFSPDGRLLASAGNDGIVRLWSVATHRQVGAPMTTDTLPVYALAFSPDGRLLATGSNDGTARLWYLATHRQIGTSLNVNNTSGIVRNTVSGSVNAIAFTPNGKLLLTGSSSGYIQFWGVGFPGDLMPAVCAIAGHSLDRQQWDADIPSEPFRKLCP